MANRVKYLVQVVPHLEERNGADKAQAIVRSRPRTRPAVPEGGTRT